jgi:hypothetical protein
LSARLTGRVVDRDHGDPLHRLAGAAAASTRHDAERVVVDAEVAEVLEQLLLVGHPLPRLPRVDRKPQLADGLGVAQRRGIAGRS